MLVFLCGLMGSGKTTVGPLLAVRLGVPFRDLDREIELEAGSTVRELFEREGEAGFRDREAQALARIAQGSGVVALGGGALGRPESLARVLRAGQLVWLDAPTEVLLARIGDVSSRPLLASDPVGVLERLRAERAAQYGRAGLRVDTSALDAAAVVDRIAAWLENA